MKCKKVKILLAPYILDDFTDDLELVGQLESHLRNCDSCRQEYHEIKELIGFIGDHKDIFTEAFAEVGYKRKIQKQKNIRLIRRIGAVAACLIIGIFTWTIFSTSASKTTPEVALQQTVSEPKPSVKIELIAEDGSSFLVDKQHITSGSKLQTLVINGKHRMVMNAHTSVSIEPLMVNAQLGCLVKLANGRIYTHVEHDGNPFIVDTANGQAVITGTTFDVKATKDSTMLVVIEGTVRFESEKGTVNVAAGQKSKIVGQSTPSIPLTCNTYALSTWATGLNTRQEITSTVYQSEFNLPLTSGAQQIDLERIDYKSWIEQRRDWFKREFPHIFKFKEALAKEGIEVEYPELLIKSGDLWRFAYPDETSTQLIPASYQSMVRLASAYDKNELWLSDNLYISPASPTSEDETSDLKAFYRWTNALKETLDSPSRMNSKLLMYSLHASLYLLETKTLAWLAASNDIALKTIEKEKIVVLLEQEINAATNCVEQFKQLFISSCSSSTCGDDKQRKLLQKIIKNIEEIAANEKRLEPAYLEINKANLLKQKGGLL